MSPVDEEARQLARNAMARIETHEAVCTERYIAMKAQTDTITSQLSELFRRWWWLIGLIIAGQGAVILLLMKMTSAL